MYVKFDPVTGSSDILDKFECLCENYRMIWRDVQGLLNFLLLIGHFPLL